MNFLIGALATSRIARFVVEDELAQPIRGWAFKLDPETKNIGYLASCIACSSVWAGIVVLIMPAWVKKVLAFSEATIITNKLMQRVVQY